MRYLKVVPFLAVLAVILFTGLKPEPIPQAFDQQDKLHHLLGLAAFAFTLRMAFPRWKLPWALMFGLGVALLIEVAQGYQPHRDASVGDMLANMLGVLLGAYCAVLDNTCLTRGRSRRSHRKPMPAAPCYASGASRRIDDGP